MKIKYWFHVLVLILCVASVAFIYGCGSAASGGGGGGGATITNRDGSYSYSGTQSPGDVWTWVISKEAFFGTCESGAQVGLWVGGTWVTLPSGFGKATVTSAGGPSAPPVDGSAHAYFLEFPDTMLLVKPDDSDSRVMICAAAATQEPNAGQYLYVNIPESGWNFGASRSLGTVEAVRLGLNHWRFYLSSFTLTGEVNAQTPQDFIFSNGTFTNETDPLDKTKIFMTPSGVFFGDSGPNKGGFAGASMEALTASQLFSKVFVLNRSFKGVRFIYNPVTSTGETEPITCTKNTTMDALMASSYTNIDTGTQPGPGVSITFEASAISGFFVGYATQLNPSSPGTERFLSSASLIGPAGKQKYMLYGIGVDSNGRPWNFLLIQTSTD